MATPAAPVAPEVVYRELPRWRVVLLALLIPACLTSFGIAVAGTYALTDLWRSLIEWNPFCNAVAFNGSLFGILYSAVQLHKHRQAKKQQAGIPPDRRSRQEKRQDAREQKKVN